MIDAVFFAFLGYLLGQKPVELLIGSIREPWVVEGFFSCDPLAWVEVRHLADEVLEIGIKEIALPESEGPTWVFVVE